MSEQVQPLATSGEQVQPLATSGQVQPLATSEQVQPLASFGIYVINLDHRQDRLLQITKELQGIPFKRFSAIKTSPGIVGCGLSHLAVLKEARALGIKNLLIFEDDFTFMVDKDTFWKKINDFFVSGQPFDVLMLSYSLQKSEPFGDGILKVLEAQTTSGYIVNHRFYDKLIDLYEEEMPLLESTGKHWIYAVDQIWKKLQPEADWFAFTPRLGKQIASMGDCGYTPEFKDYGV